MTKQSVDSWVAVAEASGTASADEIEDVTRMAISQSAPDVAARTTKQATVFAEPTEDNSVFSGR